MYKISDRYGRVIDVVRLDLVSVYKDILEGSPEMVSRMVRNGIDRGLRQEYGDRPNQIVDDLTKHIQPCRVYAEMRSPTPVKNEMIHDFVYSLMGMCIFTDSGLDLQSIMNIVITNVEWDRHAVNLCFDDM